MNMKKIYAVFISGLSVLAFSSCEGFLDKFPETSLSPETFYTSEKELELATNGFYTTAHFRTMTSNTISP